MMLRREAPLFKGAPGPLCCKLLAGHTDATLRAPCLLDDSTMIAHALMPKLAATAKLGNIPHKILHESVAVQIRLH